MRNENIFCISCGRKNLDKNTIGINRKMLGSKVNQYYCMECLAAYLDTSVEDLLEKIDEFKNEGCTQFQ